MSTGSRPESVLPDFGLDAGAEVHQSQVKGAPRSLCLLEGAGGYREVSLPEDKYEFGMLLDEAKFFRLGKIVDALKAKRRTRQEKSFRNVITEQQR